MEDGRIRSVIARAVEEAAARRQQARAELESPRVRLPRSSRAEGLVSLVSLTVMEIVLGIDNIMLVAILSQKVAPDAGPGCGGWGSALALVLRIAPPDDADAGSWA